MSAEVNSSPDISPAWQPWSLAQITGFSCAAAALAVGAPLLTYTASLAAFGLAHVLSELRYVHARLGQRVSRGLAWVLGVPLGAIVALRVAALCGVTLRGWHIHLELGLVWALAAGVLPWVYRSGGMRALLAGVALCVGLAVGLALSPIATILVLAVLHNITPVGFLAELAPDRATRRRWVAVSVLLCVGLPLLIATGLPWRALASVGLYLPDWTPLPAGPLAEQLGVYLPQAWHAEAWASHAFSAVVCAQVLHYGAVIHVMPRLLSSAPRDEAPVTIRQRAAAVLPLLAVVLCGVLLVGFTQDFSLARRIYGVAAAVHAWLEVPLLMLVLLPWLGDASGDAGLQVEQCASRCQDFGGDAGDGLDARAPLPLE